MSLMTDAAWKLCQKYGGTWGSYPDHPVEDWQSEVANHDTVLGYWNWVEGQIEQAEDENEMCANDEGASESLEEERSEGCELQTE